MHITYLLAGRTIVQNYGKLLTNVPTGMYVNFNSNYPCLGSLKQYPLGLFIRERPTEIMCLMSYPCLGIYCDE